MVRIDIKGPVERHLLLYTLVGFLGLWAITYSWLWKSERRTRIHSQNPSQITDNVRSKDSNNYSALLSDPANTAMEFREKQVKIMTWNLQGLLRVNLPERTAAVTSLILSEKPDAVFFQELIRSSYEQINQSLATYYDGVSGARNADYSRYFTGIFFKKRRFKMKHHEVFGFSNSVMDRTLLVVKLVDISRPKLKLALLTSHLESLPRFKSSRLEQLKQCFSLCTALDEKYNVVFGGDLNLEENEEAGLVPENVKDVWKECGSLEAWKYTWDMRHNRNEQVPGLSIEDQPRARYDRLYFRGSTPSIMDPTSFHLLGLEEVNGTSYFPSDHWALMSKFQLREGILGENKL